MSDLDKLKTRAVAKFIAQIDEAELAVRIGEALMGLTRPEGATAEQTLDGTDADIRAMFRAAARAAMEYWGECIRAAARPS